MCGQWCYRTERGGAASRVRHGALRLFRSALDDVRGVTAVEFGLIASPFLLTLVAIFQTGYAFFSMSVVSQGQTPTGYYAYLNANGDGLKSPPLDATGPFCPGAGSQYVVLQVQYPTSYFIGLFASAATSTFNGKPSYVLMATTTFRSEPYAGSVAYAGC